MDESKNIEIGLKYLLDYNTVFKQNMSGYGTWGYIGMTTDLTELMSELGGPFHGSPMQLLNLGDKLASIIKLASEKLTNTPFEYRIHEAWGDHIAIFSSNPPRMKRNSVIENYQKALSFQMEPQHRSTIYYRMANVYQFLGGKTEEIIHCKQKIIELVGLDDSLGRNAAKDIEELKSRHDGGCFIATATFESPLALEVLVLRRFKDNVLNRYLLGRAFIRIYYCVSPFVARIISSSIILKTISRNLLGRLITFLRRRDVI